MRPSPYGVSTRYSKSSRWKPTLGHPITPLCGLLCSPSVPSDDSVIIFRRCRVPFPLTTSKRIVMFRKRFKSAKCKTLVRLAMSRIKLLRNKRDMQLKQMRREMALLLESGQDPSARIRVEHIIREQNIMAAYDIIELFCELIVVRLPIIESQRQCPFDLREGISSLIFAAPRCADIPELLDIRSLFGAKYGKEFVAAAAELRPDCGVNRTIIEKLSVRPPSGEVKLKLMKEIAKEHHIEWDPAESEAELLKLPEDLLEGPSKFVGASQMPVDSEKRHFHSVSGSHSQDLHQNPSREPSSSTNLPKGAPFSQSPSVSQISSESATTTVSSVEDVYHKSEINSSSGRKNVNPADSLQDSSGNRALRSFSSVKSVSFTPRGQQSDSHKVEARNGNIIGTSSSSYGRSNENGSLGSHTECNMYFKDTASAAQVAADSAERALAAARAAAHLANQNNLSKESHFSDEVSDFNGRRRVQTHSKNENFCRSASGQISKQSGAPDINNGCRIPMKRSSSLTASQKHGNMINYADNRTSVVHPIGREEKQSFVHPIGREEKQSFGARGGLTRHDFDVKESSPPKKREMVYSNTLSCEVLYASDGMDSDSDEEVEAERYEDSNKSDATDHLCSDDSSHSVPLDFQHPQSSKYVSARKSSFITNSQHNPQYPPTFQPPRRPPPGVPLSYQSDQQYLPSMGESRTSRESSLKDKQVPSSHIHPKLPDYDALAARFEALKSNRH